MIRDKSIEEIYDGKFYGINDLAKIDCNGCKGCSACCHGMGSSIVLDPLDAHRLAAGLKCTVADLLQDHTEDCDENKIGEGQTAPARLELNVVDGLILPSLRLSGKEEACTFLNEDGRCSIHSFRPGVCRLFPLGRYYDGNGDYTYIVQAGECPYPAKSKIKIKKWIDTPNYEEYHRFVLSWHDCLKQVQGKVREADEIQARAICIQILQTFYLTPYREEDFYKEFHRRVRGLAERIA